jgi:glycosyltransferase involved in cell wall biosynthesis
MISILLASYNGERFIAEQIESLLNQTAQDFRVYICDDKSTDSTWAILRGYAEKHADTLFISQNEANSGGAKYNIFGMMARHKDDYLMLCDQDDVWMPDKVERTLARMKEGEAEYGAGTPLLVYTDLRVVDENLETISPSFKEAMNADYHKTQFRHQIIQNTLTGCTAMYNRALANLIGEAPPYMVMHDWWLMLVASAFGKIAPLDEQTVLYRQHGKNEIGAKDVRTLRYKLHKILHYQEVKEALRDTYRQAESFLSVYESLLTPAQKKLLTAYCDIPNHCKPVRWIIFCRLGVHKHGIARKIAQLIYI